MAFFLHRAEPDKGAGKRTFNGAGSKISQDHPLNMPPGAFPEQVAEDALERGASQVRGEESLAS